MRDLAERARAASAAITEEEDAAITAAAMSDKDAPPNRFLGEWRMRRFLKTLPPIIADAEIIRRAFRRDIGREFNPWSRADREIVQCGGYRAIGTALDKVWGRQT